MDFIFGVFKLIFFIIIALGVIALLSYNKLQRLAQDIRERSSNVQIAISKKLSLINQLMDVVKGYLESEQFTLLKVSQDNSPQGMTAAYQQSGAVLTSLQGMAERFPNLKADGQFHRLIDSIQAGEQEIQQQRQGYNAAVKAYNAVCLSIPTVLVARYIGFSAAPYLEFDHAGLQDVTSLNAFKTDDGERLQQLLGNAGSQLAGATRSLASQAAQAGKLLGEKIKEASANANTSTQYFYRATPEAVPTGPVTSDLLYDMLHRGELAAEALVAEVGSSEWLPLSALPAALPAPTQS